MASEFLKRPFHVQTGAVHEMTAARIDSAAPVAACLHSCASNSVRWCTVAVAPAKVNKDIEQRVVFCSDEADKAAHQLVSSVRLCFP